MLLCIISTSECERGTYLYLRFYFSCATSYDTITLIPVLVRIQVFTARCYQASCVLLLHFLFFYLFPVFYEQLEIELFYRFHLIILLITKASKQNRRTRYKNIYEYIYIHP